MGEDQAVMDQSSDTSNNIWSGLSSLIDSVGNAVSSVRTAAAPNGTPSSGAPNPFPGTVGPYPQAQVKTGQGAAPIALAASGPGFSLQALSGSPWAIGGIALLAFLILRKMLRF